MDTLGLGRIGIGIAATDSYLDDACELDTIGYPTLWLAGGQIDRLGRLADLVDATENANIVPGIVPVDVFGPSETRKLYDDLGPSGRFVLGLGGPQTARPLAKLNAYLDELALPAHHLILAALGPRKLEIARDRAAGAVTLLVTADYTADARKFLGDSVLVVDQFVVLETDPSRARGLAREPLSFLVTVPGYRNNLLRMGFTSEDVEQLSDRLVDAVVAWGSVDSISARVDEHLDAGADHVVLELLGTSALDAGRAMAELVATPK
ncbi:MAG: TIGR03620 family F420-dependent LLM class oxidoreductase [Rhodococcus sp. (in: high G+C Gram-positive bacteria)]